MVPTMLCGAAGAGLFSVAEVMMAESMLQVVEYSPVRLAAARSREQSILHD